MELFLSEHCFQDQELKAFCGSKSHTIGHCSFTGHADVPVLELTELESFFTGILQLFEEDTSQEALTLIEVLERDWNLFCSKEIGTKVLNEVCNRGQSGLLNPEDKAQYATAVRKVCDPWDRLKSELKWEKRFHFNIDEIVDHEWDRLFSLVHSLESDAQYYRGRLHKQEQEHPYPKCEMGAPPKDKATAGRANVNGIPVLYLCDDIETVPYEVRATYLDDISIGTFQQREPTVVINIIDFTRLRSLYSSDANLDPKTIVQYKLLTELISKDLSKPLRRYDSELEYIPTQFICEFIKLMSGAKGIRFESSLHPEYTNLVIFEPELMECISVEHKLVDRIEISMRSM